MLKILVLYLSVGSGHQAAANSIRHAIAELDPDAEVVCRDPLADAWEGFPELISTLSVVPLFLTPQLYDRMWRDGEGGGLMSRLVGADIVQSTVRAVVDEVQPGAVVCTHAFPLNLLTAMARSSPRRMPPLFAVPTDFGLHAFWPAQGVARYFVANWSQKSELVGRGVHPGRIIISGIPISPKFVKPMTAETMRTRLRLAPGLPTVLLLAGGIHSGPYAVTQLQMDGILQQFRRENLPIQLVVVCGRNRLLRNYLQRRTSKFRFPVRVLGYVEEMPALMSLSSVLVTKPGGLISAETLAMGLPIVLMKPGPGQEEANARFLVDGGAAISADSPAGVVSAVCKVLRDPDRKLQMRTRALRLGRPDAAYRVAAELLRTGRPARYRGAHPSVIP